MDKVIAFDVWADYAYFRRSYTTTSIINYPFPQRPTIVGLIAGILGYAQDSYHHIFNEENSRIGLRIMNPIKKIDVPVNMLYTKDRKGFYMGNITNPPHAQVNMVLLKDVKYRIYVSLKDEELLYKLFNMLKEHKAVYTPYLGTSNCICDFSLAYDEIFDLEKCFADDEGVDINTVVINKEDNDILIEGKPFGTVSEMAGYMDNNRVVTKWFDFYYLKKPDTIHMMNDEYYKVGDENIVLF